MGLSWVDFKSSPSSTEQNSQFIGWFWTKCAVGQVLECVLILIVIRLLTISLSMDLGVAICKYKVKSPSLPAVHQV